MNLGQLRSQSNLFSVLVFLLVLLFPLGMASVKSWASGITLVLFVLAMLAVWRGEPPELCRRTRLLLIGAACFVLAALFSFVNADDLQYSLSRLAKYLPMILSVVLVVGLRRLKVPLMKAFVRGLVVAGPVMLAVALHALWWQGLPRAQGYYHPIVFAELSMVTSMLLVCALLCRVVSRGWEVGAWVSLLAAFLASMLAESRGVWFALPVVVLMMAYVFRDRVKTRGVLVGLAGPVILLLVLPLILPHSVGEQITRTYRSIECFVDGSEVNTSLGQRLLMWQVALDVWNEHPLVGSGLGDFQIEAEQRIVAGETPLNKAWMHAHSIYFESLSTTGIFGFVSLLVAFFLIPVWLFLTSWKGSAESMEQFAALAGLTLVVCFATFGLSEAWTTRSPLINSYALMLSLFLAHTVGGGEPKERIQENVP